MLVTMTMVEIFELVVRSDTVLLWSHNNYKEEEE